MASDDAIKAAYQRVCFDLFTALREDDKDTIARYLAAANGLEDAYPELIEEVRKSV